MLDPGFVLDDDGRRRLTARFGAEVEAWCAALPAMVGRYCQRWHLELDAARSGNSSRVFTGRQHGGRSVVLKLTPDRAIANEEAIALRAWAATPHAVDLLDADLEVGALLLERIEPGTKASDQPGPRPSAKSLGCWPDCARRPGTAGRGCARWWIRSCWRRATAGPGSWPAAARRGCFTETSTCPTCCGAGPGRGLVAIDPRPGTGDLAFDATDWTLDRAISIDEVRERVG